MMTDRITEKQSIRTIAGAVCGALLLAVTLPACGEKEEPEEGPATEEQGQTIARVNGQEITEHELEAELKRLGPIESGERPAMAREVLRRMVQRAVLAQKAKEKELHRTPGVMMELRRKRAEILARAYVEDDLARQLPVSKYDVEDFIDGHPHYFAGRKHYVFDQLLVDNDLMTEEIIGAIKNLTSLEDVAEALKERNVAFSRRLNANLGSQFPKDTVARLNKLEPGDVFLTETDDQTVISELVEARLQPVPEAEARNVAKRLLTARRDAVATRRIIEGLLANSKIEFLGGFSDMQLFPGENSGAEPAEGAEDEAEGKDEDEEEKAGTGTAAGTKSAAQGKPAQAAQ
ncbi:MAG: EpsD family peptidyl-prolyl cis-trans isomerase [Alphaproteobacteria bacterium]